MHKSYYSGQRYQPQNKPTKIEDFMHNKDIKLIVKKQQKKRLYPSITGIKP